MPFGASLRHLGDLVDEWAGTGVRIESVRVSDGTDPDGEDVSAVVSLAIDLFDSDGTPPVVVNTTPTLTEEDTLALDLETSLPVGNVEEYDVAVDPGDATLRSDGRVAVTVELSLPGPPAEGPSGDSTADASSTPAKPANGDSTDERPKAEGTDSQSPEERGGGSPDSSTDGGSRDVPPFKDPALLRDVYESHDTFAEMAAAIEMDVTGETVRRYMIDAGIHEPNSYRTGGTDTAAGAGSTESDGAVSGVRDSDAPAAPAGDSTSGTSSESRAREASPGSGAEPARSESPAGGHSIDGTAAVDDGEKTLVSDGIGIPDSVELDDLIETVNRSRTIHEVTMDLDFDRTEARELLQELNLLDLVVGRIDSDPNRTISREDVIDRLREVSHPEC